jgi:acetolactate synthase-1/2/3 large subunit
VKGSDHVAKFLGSRVGHVFGLQGGAVVHLFDSCERLGPKPIYCHHEQAAGFAACAYARVKGFAACIVTTGPGAANALTPCLGAYQDSLPVMFISGQTRSQHRSRGLPVRQVGTQEANIVDVAHHWTKCAYEVTDVATLPLVLQAACEASVADRPGPVWISIPLDIQYATHSG